MLFGGFDGPANLRSDVVARCEGGWQLGSGNGGIASGLKPDARQSPAMVYARNGENQEVAIFPTGSRSFESGPTHGDVAAGSWAWSRGEGAPQAGRDSSEGLGGGGAAERRSTGSPSGAYPPSPSDARARELAREVTKAWNERGGELIEKAAYIEMKAVLMIWESIALVSAFRLAGALGETLLSSACFVAGTEVWTAEGLVPIEQVTPGQLVLSRDEATGELGWKSVVRTFATADQATLTLSLRTVHRVGRGAISGFRAYVGV